jgi:hypothetical protein
MSNEQERKTKKPFYKRWWFIALAVAVVIGAVLDDGEEDIAQEETEVAAEENDVEVNEENDNEENNNNSEANNEEEDLEPQNCSDFSDGQEVFYFWIENDYHVDNDPLNLDGDNTGVPCRQLTEDMTEDFMHWEEIENGQVPEAMREEYGDEEEAEEDSEEIDTALYEDELKPHLEYVIAEYDRIWDEEFQTIASDMEHGTYDSEASLSEGLMQVQESYTTLEMEAHEYNISSETPEPIEEHMETFNENMSEASMLRGMAAYMIAEAIADGDMSEGRLSTPFANIEDADGYMIKAALAWTEIKMHYDDLEE